MLISRDRAATYGRIFAVVVAGGLLASCSGAGETTSKVVRSMNPMNWFDDEAEEKRPTKPLDEKSQSAQEKSYPNLGTVPERPKRPSAEEQTKRIAEGLAADTENARYTDQQLRASTAVFGGKPQPPSVRSPGATASASRVSPPSADDAGSRIVPPPAIRGPEPEAASSGAPPPVRPPQPRAAGGSPGRSETGSIPPPIVRPPAAVRPPPADTASATQPPPVRAPQPVRAPEPVTPPQPVKAPEVVKSPQPVETQPVRPPQAVRPPEPSRQVSASETSDVPQNGSAGKFVTPRGEPSNEPKSPPKPEPLRGPANEQVAKVSPPPSARLGPPSGETATAPRGEIKSMQVGTIYFGDGSSQLSGTDVSVLEAVGDMVRQTGGRVRVVGHSSMGARTVDPERRELVNFRMSLKRANAVASELVRMGIPADRVEVVAQGDKQPLYAETSKTGAAYNRRAEIYVDYLDNS